MHMRKVDGRVALASPQSSLENTLAELLAVACGEELTSTTLHPRSGRNASVSSSYSGGGRGLSVCSAGESTHDHLQSWHFRVHRAASDEEGNAHSIARTFSAFPPRYVRPVSGFTLAAAVVVAAEGERADRVVRRISAAPREELLNEDGRDLKVLGAGGRGSSRDSEPLIRQLLKLPERDVSLRGAV